MTSGHPTLVAIAVVAVMGAGVGVVLGLALFSGDDPKRQSTEPPTSPSKGQPGAPSGQRLPRAARQAVGSVNALVKANARGDGPAFCRLLRRKAGDAAGPREVHACARRARINASLLPRSGKAQVKSIGISGKLATIVLYNGPTIKLERTKSGWRVSGVKSAG